MNELNAARTKKALDKLYRFDTGVMSLRDFLSSVEMVRKSSLTSNVSEKRVHLEYKQVKPKTTYTIWYKKANSELGIDVSKLVFDFYNLPETRKDISIKE